MIVTFGVGLQLIRMTKDEFKQIIDNYHDHISYIYYSSLLDMKFYARKIINTKEKERFNHIDPQDQYELLKYARDKYNIPIELCVNSYSCKSDEDFINMFKHEITRLKPDKCVTYNRMVDKLHQIAPDIKYELSFNEGLYYTNDIDKLSQNVSSVVLGGRFIRDKRMIDKVLESGRIPNILINNSCAHNCGYCGRCNCLNVFDRNLSICDNDVNIPFAIQTLFPYELYDNREIYTNNLIYKLSTRLCTYNELDFLLKSYINNMNDFKTKQEFHAICPLRHFEKYYDDIDIHTVINLKEKIWSKIKEVEG